MSDRLLRGIACVALGVALCLTGSVAATRPDVSNGLRFLPLVTAPPSSVCGPWLPVNEYAFGLGTGADDDYSSEEGFEVLAFEDRLYVGMEADNSMGARLWRTIAPGIVPRRQSDWEEVIADAAGRPFGVVDTAPVDHVDSLAAFDEALYVSTANRSGVVSGTLVFRSPTGDPGTWEPANTAGFGDPNNENFKDMHTYTVAGTEWLCGGTGNTVDGAEVWCTDDGRTWEQKNESGFGMPANRLVTSSAVYDGALYLGIMAADGVGSVWRTTELSTWTNVYTASNRPRVEVIGSLDGYLYVAEGAADGRQRGEPTIRISRSASGDPGSWTPVGTQIQEDPHNTRTVVDGAARYNDALYVAIMNTVTGVQVWRTDGTTWTHVTEGHDGFGSPDTFAAELLAAGDYLYAWTSNYTHGQRVLRTTCAAPDGTTGQSMPRDPL